ncbi:helix-turn-helix domain-containing protein [Larkinella terrae]|nr:helix-turn-helix domain-containing protein [Larkinella terrae]
MERKQAPILMANAATDQIGERVKKYRRLRNLSQEELAELSSLSVRTIQRLEKGESIGSPYTLRTLATSLQISPDELMAPLAASGPNLHPTTLKYLLILNWSALAGIVAPLANIILPAILLWRRRHDQTVQAHGRQMISFQILWTLVTLGMMLVIPLLLTGLSMLVGGPFPMFIPVYFICLIVNVFFLFRIALHLPGPSPFLNRLPKFL